MHSKLLTRAQVRWAERAYAAGHTSWADIARALHVCLATLQKARRDLDGKQRMYHRKQSKYASHRICKRCSGDCRIVIPQPGSSFTDGVVTCPACGGTGYEPGSVEYHDELPAAKLEVAK